MRQRARARSASRRPLNRANCKRCPKLPPPRPQRCAWPLPSRHGRACFRQSRLGTPLQAGQTAPATTLYTGGSKPRFPNCLPIMPFALFERLVDPFPPRDPARAPGSVYRFCRHHARGLEGWLLLLALLSTGIAIVEVALFDVLGRGVDLLSNSSPEQIADEGGRALLTGRPAADGRLPAARGRCSPCCCTRP
jgi:hypothetical protein